MVLHGHDRADLAFGEETPTPASSCGSPDMAGPDPESEWSAEGAGPDHGIYNGRVIAPLGWAGGVAAALAGSEERRHSPSAIATEVPEAGFDDDFDDEDDDLDDDDEDLDDDEEDEDLDDDFDDDLD
jgi:hypothetical protein